MKGFTIIVAADQARGIGRGNALPWRLPGEMAYFKRVTSEARANCQNAVVMGRKTYESIPEKFRPLPGRKNVVLTRAASLGAPSSVAQASTLDAAIASLAHDRAVDRIFVIGGGTVYLEALQHPQCEQVLLTQVHAIFGCDTFLPELPAAFALVRQDGPHQDQDVRYTFETYARNNPKG